MTLADDIHKTEIVLRRDADTILLRRPEGDVETTVLVLSPVAERPDPILLKRFHHEFGLREHLNATWAAVPKALEETGGRSRLVLSDPGGEPLMAILERWKGAQKHEDLTTRLKLCLAIATALTTAHEQHLVHKDISPNTVLIDDSFEQAWLTGFGTASWAPREMQRAGPSDTIVGSFPYMAPEQTGRMNRSVDQRGDLYSLGVIFYEVLSGQLPFRAADPMEWVHCHIARTPVSPNEHAPDLPAPLCDIVLKLLAKTPEDRYQTASGVVADLRHCLNELEQTGNIKPFALAQNDLSGRLIISERLYGRERESNALLETFARVTENGVPELVLVSGYSGIGKSALVNQIQPAIVERQGLFGSGKFDQHKRNIPYTTLAQAFQSLIRHVLSRNETEVETWRTAVQTAVGSNGALLIDLIPELEYLIGRQPAVPELPPGEALARFRSLFRRFVSVFATPERPLVLFLDDLQWIDSGSLKLLEDLTTHPDVHRVLLIGAYRDNEATSAHPLMLSVETIRKGGGRVSDILLGPLSEADLEHMIADALHEPQNKVSPLAALVYGKTGGNPFFTIQFLTTLFDENLLHFEPEEKRWVWSTDGIAAKGFSDNVADLMAARIERLPNTVQDQLRRVAAHGFSVRLTTLETLDEQLESEVMADMQEPLRTGLLMWTGERFAFAHDRIQEAAYQSIPEEKRAKIHLALGRSFLSKMSRVAIEENVFLVVNQLNLGGDLIEDSDELATLRDLNAMAGKKAKAATDYASARAYFLEARALLAQDAWETAADNTFDLLLQLAECEYLVGNHDQAEALFRQLHDRAMDDARRAQVWRLRFRMTMVAGRFGEAVDIAVNALSQFGLTCPESSEEIADAVTKAQDELRTLIGGREISSLIDLPICKDPSVRALIGVIADAIPAAYHVRPLLYPFLGLTGIILSLKHGITEDSSTTFSGYSVSLVGRFEDFHTGFSLATLAIRLDEERFMGTQLRGTLLFRLGYFVSPWRRPIGECMPTLEESFRDCLENGNLIYAAYTAYASSWMLLEKGEPLDVVLANLHTYAPFARTTRIGFASLMIRLQELFVLELMGTPEEDSQAKAAKAYAEMEATKHGYGIAFYHVIKQVTPFLMNDWESALAAAEETAAMLPKISSSVIEVSHHLLSALTMTALMPEAEPDRRQTFRKALAEHRRKLRLWADSCPETFGCRSLLLEAEMARLEKRDADALKLFEQALASARDNKQLLTEAIANERAGTFCLDRGLEVIANTYLRNARYAFLRWGTMIKVNQLDKLYPHLAERRHSARIDAASFSGSVEGLDLITVVKAQQAVSSEIKLDRIVETLLRIALEHAGADSGALILPHSDGYRIEATARTTENSINVQTVDATPGADDIPDSVFHFVTRSRERVVLDDASAPNTYDTTAFAARTGVKSLLCLPVTIHGALGAVLYLENHLTTDAFTDRRIAVLDLLASQASISLENATLYAEMEDRVRERTRDLTESLDTVQAKSKQVANLLDNSGQGFLSFDCDMVIDPEFSRACVEMLHDELGGRDVCNVLWPHAPATASLMREATKIALSDCDALKKLVMLNLLPKEMHRDGKTLEAEYKILDNGHMMLVLTDVTEERRLGNTVEAERRHLEMIVAAITDGHVFFDTIETFRAFAETDLDRLLSASASPSKVVQDIYRQIHTFKGLLNQFSFTRTPIALHDLESRLDVLRRQGDDDITLNEIATVARSVPYMDLLNEDLNVIREVLGPDFLGDGERILLTADQAHRLRTLSLDLLSGNPVDVHEAKINSLLRDFSGLGEIVLTDALVGHDPLVQRVAERCEKEVAPIRVSGDTVKVDPEHFGPVLRTLGHLFRNAVDHGIELPDDRLENGKNETGIIDCTVRDEGHDIRIEIADDGAGLDLDALRARVTVMRGSEEATALSDDALINLMLTEGISTRTRVSEDSGRGMGIAAVKAAVDALGGHLWAESTRGYGVRFILSLPKPQNA